MIFEDLFFEKKNLHCVRHVETNQVRSQVLTAASMKVTDFCDIAPCGLGLEVRTASIVGAMIIALMMEPVHTSETSVYFYETTLRNIPEGSHLETN
jgi:hypothetical protein